MVCWTTHYADVANKHTNIYGLHLLMPSSSVNVNHLPGSFWRGTTAVVLHLQALRAIIKISDQVILPRFKLVTITANTFPKKCHWKNIKPFFFGSVLLFTFLFLCIFRTCVDLCWVCMFSLCCVRILPWVPSMNSASSHHPKTCIHGYVKSLINSK